MLRTAYEIEIGLHPPRLDISSIGKPFSNLPHVGRIFYLTIEDWLFPRLLYTVMIKFRRYQDIIRVNTVENFSSSNVYDDLVFGATISILYRERK